jgi:membrane-bound lytic murein transglycosylase B
MPNRLSRWLVLLTLVCASAVVPIIVSAQEAAAPPTVPFADWLADLRKEALARGITERTVEAALTGLEPIPVVVERDKTQPERTLTIDQYLKRRVDRKTVRTAREMARRDRKSVV